MDHPPPTAEAKQNSQFTLRQLFAGLTIIGLCCGVFVWLGVIGLCFAMLWLVAAAWSFNLVKMYEAVVAVLAIVFLTLTSLPAVQSAGRGSASLSKCQANLKQIGLALHTYASDYGSYPPTVVAHAQGRPLHSWRTLLAPYIERDDLYSQYEMSEPWDGPTNRLLHAEDVKLFQCPRDPAARQGMGIVSYLAIVSDAAKPGEPFAVIELLNSGVNFFEPSDISLADLLPGITGKPRFEIKTGHSGHSHVNVLWTDGSVEIVPIKQLPARLEKKLMRSTEH